MSSPEVILSALSASKSRQEQIGVLRDSWLSLTKLQVSQRQEALCEEAASVLEQLERCSSKEAQLRVLKIAITERSTISALDVAVAPVLMPPNVLQVVKSGIVKACVQNLSSHAAGDLLDGLEEGCFMSAAQAAEVMRGVQSVGRSDEFKWWHVVCARVIDKWNLSEEHHTQVACYYGCTRASMVRLLREVSLDEPEMLQNRALSQVGRGDHTDYARSQRVSEFAAILIARNLRAGSSGAGAEEDTCAVCLETCADGSALWTCGTCANRLHAKCARAWVLKVKARAQEYDNDDDDDDDESEAACPYCRAPARNGSFSVGVVPRGLKRSIEDAPATATAKVVC